jgi:hypothetical protein
MVTRTARMLAIIIAVAATVGLAVALLRTPDTARPDATQVMRDTSLAHERLIADCMRQQGFDYTAAVPADVAVEAARHAANAAGADVAAAVRDAQRQAGPDPNDAVLAAMTPQRQAAWGDALYGTATTPGCYYGTYKAAWGVDPLTLGTQGEQLTARVEADPAVRAALTTYLACMADRGFAVADAFDLPNVVERRGTGRTDAEVTRLRADAEAAQALCLPAYQRVYDDATRRLQG